jgi:excinuclease UvrABC ATPase subunit
VNNLKDVSVELPKRRLTVFTGVSGSGKSSLVFGMIAAESQRLINETYSAFVQGFMPTLARPEVDVPGRHVPALRGPGSVTDFDRSRLDDDGKSLTEGALTIPGYSMDGWYGRIFRGCGFFDPDKPIRKYTKKELQDLLYKEPTKIKVEGINLTYEGLIPRIQKSMLSRTSTPSSRTSAPSWSGL